jgi:hypothetical protein
MGTTNEVSTKGNPNLRVFILDDESSKMDACLGITEERSDELIEIVKQSHENCETHTDAFVNISKGALHANELVYMMFQYGAHAGANKVASEMNNGGLKNLLEELKRKINPEEGESEE